MNDEVLARVSTPEELEGIDSILHDAWFSMAHIGYYPDLGLVRIPIERELVDKRRKLRHSNVAGVDDRSLWLEVSLVEQFEAIDPEGLDRHSYSRLRYPSDNRLILQSNFPGGLEMAVSALAITLRLTSN